MLLPHLGASQVSAVLSRNFLRTLVNHLNDRNSYLHAHAKKCLERLSGQVEKSASGEFKLAVALALQRAGGNGFDQVRPACIASVRAHSIYVCSSSAEINHIYA